MATAQIQGERIASDLKGWGAVLTGAHFETNIQPAIAAGTWSMRSAQQPEKRKDLQAANAAQAAWLLNNSLGRAKMLYEARMRRGAKEPLARARIAMDLAVLDVAVTYAPPRDTLMLCVRRYLMNHAGALKSVLRTSGSVSDFAEKSVERAMKLMQRDFAKEGEDRGVAAADRPLGNDRSASGSRSDLRATR